MRYRRHQTHPMRDTASDKIIPRLHLTNSGRVHKLERFSQYVARQMGFGNTNECPKMCELAEEYLKKGKGCEANMYELFAKGPDADMLYLKLLEEFDRCILGYFAFHWSHATLMISQVLNVDSEPQGKLKNMVMAATRKQRFERVTKNLKVARVFSTLVEEMKAIRTPRDTQCTDVMVPAAHSERSPVLLLMGGGMGAGKSTVLKEILNKESFWSGAAGNAVIVEADAFKETDVIYRALNSRAGHHHDLLQTAELVHQSSTDAASSLLVTALNEGRDVIMDGTLSWEPFVEQTIAMARNVHHHRYRMGVGYKVSEDGTINENYWEQVEEDEQQQQPPQKHKEDKKRKPYRIEMVGVVCDAYLAVVRGLRRAILMGRAVRVRSQLKSHKRFAMAFPRYCQLVDNARLYCTDAMGVPPQLIGWKDGDNNFLVDPHQINCLRTLSMLNEDADSIYELNQNQDSEYEAHPIWKDIMLSSSRASLQQELKIAIQNVENQPSLQQSNQ
ncbi:Zeta toxin domain [Macleaya cordata]|uniref:Zeta toxin domain n=1 Tax=Macleaya cordata TaxID=56857 RepID=A0A200Q4C1_MACCD|nr:Zeta toxin domain [Macleaya cordata]